MKLTIVEKALICLVAVSALIILFLGIAYGEESYSVYKSGEPVLSQFKIVPRTGLDGKTTHYDVFPSGKPVLPIFRISPDGSIYKADSPVLPLKKTDPPWPPK